MCIITGLTLGGVFSAIGGAIASAAHAVAGVATAVGGAIHTAMATSVTSLIAGTPVTVAAGATGVGSLTVGGVLAGTAAVAGIGAAAGIGIHQARASSKAQKAQMDALKELEKANNKDMGNLEVSKTTSTLKDNSRIGRTLSSLRIAMLPQKQNTEDISRNVWGGVDTNNVVTATQNMTGLNIAVA